MKTVVFYFDVISPYAYLAFERLPQALQGLSVAVSYRPILFAGLLKHWAHKGPAELEPKRQWTFRQVAWLAHQLGIPLDIPVQHPFNPLALQRLAWACARDSDGPNRWVVEQLFRHVWRGGGDANDAARMAELTRTLTQDLTPIHEPDSTWVKSALRQSTDSALQAGVFGVPTFEWNGKLFWGLDSLDMLRAGLTGDAWFDSAAWDEAGRARPGIVREAAPR